MAALKARAIALLAFALAWHFPIEGASTTPWLRLLVALVLFGLPGFLLQRVVLGETAGRLTRELTLGFVLSTTLAGGLGLVASVLRLPFAFVQEGLFVAGAWLLCVAPLRAPRGLGRFGPTLLATLPALVAIGLASRLAIAPYVGDDDIAHMARIRFFASSSGLNFEDFVFGTHRLATPRYWLSFWPLSNAVCMTRASLTPLELLAVYLAPFIAILALAALYELARSLGASDRIAGLAVVAQVCCLLLTPLRDQPGGVFWNRLAEDKTVAAFLMAPVFLRLVADALQGPSRQKRVAVALGGGALLFAHPTLLGITCVVAAAFVAIDLLVRRERAAAWLLALVLALPVVPACFRFVGMGSHHLQFSIADAQQAGELGDNRIRRLVVSDAGLYAVSPELYHDLPFALAALAAATAAFSLRKDPLARFVLGASVVILTTLVPWTAWILGKAVTPFQIWRVLWLTPFGLGSGLLAAAAASALPRLPALLTGAAQLAALAGAAGYALNLPRRVFQAWPLPEHWQNVVYSVQEDEEREDVCRTFAALEAAGRALDRIVPENGVAAGDRDSNHLIPTLSARARPFAFRTEAQTVLHGSFTREEAAARFDDWNTLTGRVASPSTRLALLDRYRVRALLTCGEAVWVRKLQNAAPGRIRKAGQFGSVRLFEVE